MNQNESARFRRTDAIEGQRVARKLDSARLDVASASGPDAGPGGLEVGNALLGGEAGVVLRTDAVAYAPGGSMTPTLENQGSERVGYNLCVHGLERLEPGRTAAYGTTVTADLASGEYRVRLPLYLPGREEQRDVTSGTFQVGG